MNRFPSSLALAALVAASLAAGAGCSILGDEADVTVQASDAATLIYFDLGVLSEAGLVTRSKRGRTVTVRLAAGPMDRTWA